MLNIFKIKFNVHNLVALVVVLVVVCAEYPPLG
jgi:hypothetical protein